jgi:catechol 2,3-dioxygenase-like lactoylglutathione lyase family enzyme
MFRHIGIVVNDLDKQLRFYRDVLELEVYYEKLEEGEFLEHILGSKKGAKAYIVKLGKNNQTIVELLDFSFSESPFEYNAKTLFDFGYTHFAIIVNDIDELSRKIDLINTPKINGDGTFKVCFCKDPEGNLIELVQCISKQG